MEKGHAMATQERTVRGRRLSDRLIAGVLRIFSRIHITVYRWTGGIIGGHIFGNRMLLLLPGFVWPLEEYPRVYRMVQLVGSPLFCFLSVHFNLLLEYTLKSLTKKPRNQQA